MNSSNIPAVKGGTPVRKPEDYLVFGAPQIREPEIEEVVSCLRSGWIGTGPRASRFETDFSDYKGAGYSVAVNSCTAALHLAMAASGIGPGDEVITTPLTFCATINSIIHCGAAPVLADCDSATMNIDPAEVLKKITGKTKAVVPVHFAGRPCDMDALCDIADRHGLMIIEDCAHAVEAEYHGRCIGTFGKAGCFSFYATKNVVTGEGGMIITDDEEFASRSKILALHGMSRDAWKRYSDDGYNHYSVVDVGFKYNMTDMQAAIGIHQLKRVEENWNKRKNIWETYQKELSPLPFVLPAQPAKDTRHAFHLFPLLLDLEKLKCTRDAFLFALHREGIGSGVHYLPVHLYPVYKKMFGWKRGGFSRAEQIGESTLSIPLSPALSRQDVEDVVSALKKITSYYLK